MPLALLLLLAPAPALAVDLSYTGLCSGSIRLARPSASVVELYCPNSDKPAMTLTNCNSPAKLQITGKQYSIFCPNWAIPFIVYVK